MERMSTLKTPPDRTELRCSYEPADFFEEPYRATRDKYDLLIQEGKAVATLRTSCDPVVDDPEIFETVRRDIEALFRVRQFLVHRQFKLGGLGVARPGGGTISVIGAFISSSITMGEKFRIVITKDGTIVSDSSADQIAAERSMLDSIAPKVVGSPILRSLLESYGRAVADPADEFFHLYEIRDALQKQFGSKNAACSALGIDREKEWDRLDTILNDPEIEQSRHRGKGPTAGRRPATPAELAEVRALAKRWIMAFAATLPEREP
jgi:hypothetical protein